MSQSTPRRNPLNIDESSSEAVDYTSYVGGEKVVDHPNSARKFTKVKLLAKPDSISTKDWTPEWEDGLHERLQNAQRHDFLPVHGNTIFPDPDEHQDGVASIGGGGMRKHFSEPRSEMVMHTEGAQFESTYRFTRRPVAKPCPPEKAPAVGKKLISSSNVRTDCTEPTPLELQNSLRMKARFNNSQRILEESNFITPTDETNYSDKEFHVKPVKFGTHGRYEHSPLPALETLQGVLTPMDDNRQRKPVRPAPFGLETD
ncbi:Copper homeostasis lipoprotein [Perkinsela sp. CCAP 1560/4]|nr:Copper homeostasis lipoprotein [Perkinsela sp. CCAP 1560/4]|eukprot:KNH07937.1 Copper homeostasis lipoprotein [Perkinsela sp. CCAP 1560/4]